MGDGEIIKGPKFMMIGTFVDVNDKKAVFIDKVKDAIAAYKTRVNKTPVNLYMNSSTSMKVRDIMGVDDDSLVSVGGLTPVTDDQYRDDIVLVGV